MSKPSPFRNAPAFKLVNGRYVRDNKVTEVKATSHNVKSGMVKFNTAFPIGFHKWAS